MEQGMQTDATHSTLQLWDLFANNVVSVFTELQKIENG